MVKTGWLPIPRKLQYSQRRRRAVCEHHGEQQHGQRRRRAGCQHHRGNNTAIGDAALASDTTGSNNIAIGFDAAVDVSGGNSNNIHIGSVGVSGDSAAIRIGTQGTQMSAFIAGISGATSSGGIEVFVNSNGQLGASTSSRRFKEQITDMGDSSSKLFQLRPVNFFYKPEYDDGSHLLAIRFDCRRSRQGLSRMVAYDNDGQILSVRYQMLAPMLLNEVQKQNAQIRSLEERLAALEALLSARRPRRCGRRAASKVIGSAETLALLAQFHCRLGMRALPILLLTALTGMPASAAAPISAATSCRSCRKIAELPSARRGGADVAADLLGRQTVGQVDQGGRGGDAGRCQAWI